MKTQWIRHGATLAALGLVLAGCAGKPRWIRQGSGAFKDTDKVFYGVGVAQGIQSEALRRATADNRALAEISKQLSAVSTSLMRDYMASASAPADAKATPAVEQQFVENTVKTFTNNVVSGVKVVDRYEGKDGTLYSLASLKLEDMKVLAGEVKDLSGDIQAHIKANAEKAFDALSQGDAKQAQ